MSYEVEIRLPPEPPGAPTGFRKFDHDKPEWWLLPMDAVREIVKVLTFGAKKYAPDNWMLCKTPDRTYGSALLRHLDAYKAGERLDPESGLHHLAHAGCCLLFMLALDLRKGGAK